MRILGLLGLSLACAVSLDATGQSTQATAPAAPVQQAPAQKANEQPAAQNAATANSVTQTASQNAPADTPDLQRSRWLALEQSASQPKPKTKYVLPQMSYDRGIYAGRNAVAGNRGCLAIQSYNFSQGETPKLESITTCTTVVQPLMRNARKPGSQHQDQDNQQDQGKDQK